MKPLLLALLVGCGDTSNEVAPAPASAPTTPAGPVAPFASGPAASATAASSREMADVGFNLAMQAYETGQPGAQTLILQAIAAYQAAGPLDSDGLFHLAVLQHASGDEAVALFSAEQILAVRPTHLLALGIAAQAAAGSGDEAAARSYHQRLLDAYDAEQGAVAEYGHHGSLLPIYKEKSIEYLTQ